MPMLKEREITNIRYTKVNEDSGTLDRFETTDRTIIPTSVPKTNIKAVDVTDLSETDQIELQSLLTEYTEYVRDHLKSAYSFEDWASHSKSIHIDVKWRTFKVQNTEIL